MVGDEESRVAWQRAGVACTASALRLREAGVAPEALAEYMPERGAFLWRRKATMRPLGEVWRLGTLLLGTDSTLFAHGRSTRAAERGRPSFQSESREERRDMAAAALHGGFEVGTPVNYGAVLLLSHEGELHHDLEMSSNLEPQGELNDPDLRELPVGFAEGEVRVRWRVGAPLTGGQSLADFLTERVELLIDPPFARD